MVWFRALGFRSFALELWRCELYSLRVVRLAAWFWGWDAYGGLKVGVLWVLASACKGQGQAGMISGISTFWGLQGLVNQSPKPLKPKGP